MDPLTHAIVTAAIVGRTRQVLWASVGADIPWYLLYPCWLVSRKRVKGALRSGNWPMPPSWIRQIHYGTHSLLTVGLVVGIAWALGRHRGDWASAWLLHILMDVPSHSRRRMAPRLFWPFSRWAYDGVSWADGIVAFIRRLLRGARSPNHGGGQ